MGLSADDSLDAPGLDDEGMKDWDEPLEKGVSLDDCDTLETELDEALLLPEESLLSDEDELLLLMHHP